MLPPPPLPACPQLLDSWFAEVRGAASSAASCRRAAPRPRPVHARLTHPACPLLLPFPLQYGRYALLNGGNLRAGCPDGARYVTGEPFLSAAALGESKHNRVSVCRQNVVNPWDKAVLFAQGNISERAAPC